MLSGPLLDGVIISALWNWLQSLITSAYWMLFPLPDSLCYMEFYPLHVSELMIWLTWIFEYEWLPWLTIAIRSINLAYWMWIHETTYMTDPSLWNHRLVHDWPQLMDRIELLWEWSYHLGMTCLLNWNIYRPVCWLDS